MSLWLHSRLLGDQQEVRRGGQGGWRGSSKENERGNGFGYMQDLGKRGLPSRDNETQV